MNKKVLTLALVVLASVGLVAASSVFAQSSDNTQNTEKCRCGDRHQLRLDMKADILGVDIEEIQAMREAGKTFPEILDELGIDREEMKEKMQAARQAHIDQLVADGVITQEQADQRLERMAERPAKHLEGFAK